MLTNEQKQQLKKLAAATDAELEQAHIKSHGWSAGAVKKEDELIKFVEGIVAGATSGLEESVDQLTRALEESEKELLGLKTGTGGNDAETIKQLKEANELLKADIKAIEQAKEADKAKEVKPNGAATTKTS